MTSSMTAEEQKTVNDYLENQFDNFFDKELRTKDDFLILLKYEKKLLNTFYNDEHSIL